MKDKECEREGREQYTIVVRGRQLGGQQCSEVIMESGSTGSTGRVSDKSELRW